MVYKSAQLHKAALIFCPHHLAMLDSYIDSHQLFPEYDSQITDGLFPYTQIMQKISMAGKLNCKRDSTTLSSTLESVALSIFVLILELSGFVSQKQI